MTNGFSVYYFVLGLALGYVVGFAGHVAVIPQW